MDNNSKVFLAFDADSAGRMIGRAVLANNPEKLLESSTRIQLGNEIFAEWAEQFGGECFSSGGDQGVWAVDASALDELEHIRKDYEFATNLTVTVGVGNSLSEAGKALLAGKLRGKNMVVHYGQDVEQEISQAQNGDSEEAKKISEAYLDTDGKDVPAEQQTQQFLEQDLNPPSMSKPVANENPPEVAIAPGENMQDKNPNNVKDPTGAPKEEAIERQAESNNEAAEDTHSAKAMENIAAAIEQDEKGGETEKDLMDDIDDEDLAIGHNAEEGTSRPENFEEQNTPQDMGLSEDEAEDATPDLTEVLKDGLDSHAEALQKQKVINLIGSSLEGFKANKHVMERAKDLAPEMYAACISMLKAMIEMSKMLGLADPQEQAEEEQAVAELEAPMEEQAEAQAEQEAQAEEDCQYCEPSAEEQKEDDCPYCKPEEEACPYCDDAKEAAPSEESKDKAALPAKAAAPAQKDKEGAIGQGLGKLPTKKTTPHVARTPYPEGAVNEKGQKKITDPKSGKTRWINMKEGRVAGPTGIPVKPNNQQQ